MPMTDVILNPAARVLWRAPATVQLELGDRAIVLDGVDRPAIAWLLGQRDGRTHSDEAPRRELEQAIAALACAGFLIHRSTRSSRELPPAPRLASELTALRSRYGDGAGRVLSRRRRATVAIQGTGRVAALVGAALAAAGVGRVCFTASGDVRLPQCAPGGLTHADEGERFSAAAQAAVHRVAPDCDTSPMPLAARPSLTVLAVESPVENEIRAALHARGCPHLAVRAGAESGSVGPLVLPGVSSCLRCADLHRLDRDPAWPALAVQLGIPGRHGRGSDVTLATLVASVTALQALGFLDDPGLRAATVDGTLELQLPDWRIRRRSWPPHPDCDCGAYVDAGSHVAMTAALLPAEWAT